MKRIEVHMSEADMLRDHLGAAGKMIGRLRRWIKRWLHDPHNHPPGIGNGTVVPNAELYAALAGRPVPRRVKP